MTSEKYCQDNTLEEYSVRNFLNLWKKAIDDQLDRVPPIDFSPVCQQENELAITVTFKYDFPTSDKQCHE